MIIQYQSRITKAGLLLLFSIVALAGCKDAHAGDGKLMERLGIEKKYYLKDCLVKLNFLWDPKTDRLTRESVFHKMRAPIMEAISSQEFPYFSGHATRTKDYYVFYFVDRCENRLELVQKLVKKKFLPNIPNFPEYEIEYEGIEPGFDGTTPFCCWLDY